MENDIICIDCSNSSGNNNRNDSVECVDCINYSKQNQTNQISNKSNYLNDMDITQIKTFDGWNCGQELDLIENLLKITNQTCIFDVNNIENEKLKLKQPNLPSDYLKHIEKWFELFSQSGDECDNERRIDQSKLYIERTKLTSFSAKDSLDSDSIGPFRPQVHSKQYRSSSGYRYARADFETEYDDTFEAKYIADLDFNADLIEYEDAEDKQIEFELKFAILRKYNEVIQKRYMLKQFIKDFGLINELGCGRFDTTIIKATKPSYNLVENDKLINFELPIKYQRLFSTCDDYLKFQGILNYRNSLIQRLSSYREYRSMGIKSHWQICIYKNLKSKRLNRITSVHMDSLLSSINRFDHNYNRDKCKEWFKKFVLVEKNLVDKTNLSSGVSSQFKYKNLPLKIEHYPDSDKLDDEEKEFCRMSRVQPTVYLRVKEILCIENKLNGSCSYSRARKIAKIDVNKTRVIHNFMLKVGLIKAS